MLTRRTFSTALASAGLFGVAGTSSDAHAADDDMLARVRSSGHLRTGVIAGAEPFFHKDLVGGTWTGACLSMAHDLAAGLGVTLDLVEAQWGTSVMDLQAGKIDVMFALSPSPQRALVMEFSDIAFNNPFTAIVRPGLNVSSWSDLDKPEIRVAFDAGSSHDVFVRRTLTHCTPVAVATPTDAAMALQTGRADCVVQVVVMAAVMHARAPGMGALVMPKPVSHQPSCIGIPAENSERFLVYINNWLLYNRSSGMIQKWMIDALKEQGVAADSLPPGLEF
jgi:polar amino acid transport system substrate-binding protein